MTGVRLVVVGMALLLTGAGCSSMRPGKLSAVSAVSDEPRVGNVYLIRGFIGIWSHGIDDLAEKIRAEGIRAHVYQEDQWLALGRELIKTYGQAERREPLILIGHSYGADDCVRIAQRLHEEKIPVDLIVTLDPVRYQKVPPNVTLCYNFYQSNLLDSVPAFRGIPLEPEVAGGRNLVNLDLRRNRRDLLEADTDHFNIEKNPKVHAEVITLVKQICLPRAGANLP